MALSHPKATQEADTQQNQQPNNLAINEATSIEEEGEGWQLVRRRTKHIKKRQSIKQALNLQDKTQKAEDLQILQLNRPMQGLSMSNYVSDAWGKIIEEHNAESQ
jgi:hypothetical protein